MDYTIAVGGSRGELFIWQLEENPNFCERYGLSFEGNKVNKYIFIFILILILILILIFFLSRMTLSLKMQLRKRKNLKLKKEINNFIYLFI